MTFAPQVIDARISSGLGIELREQQMRVGIMFSEWKLAVISSYTKSFVTHHVGRTYHRKRDGFGQHVFFVTFIPDKIIR
jgi:hypothetical protein